MNLPNLPQNKYKRTAENTTPESNSSSKGSNIRVNNFVKRNRTITSFGSFESLKPLLSKYVVHFVLKCFYITQRSGKWSDNTMDLLVNKIFQYFYMHAKCFAVLKKKKREKEETLLFATWCLSASKGGEKKEFGSEQNRSFYSEIK